MQKEHTATPWHGSNGIYMKATGQEPLKHERNRDIGHEGLHSGERYFGGRVPFGRGVQGSNHDYKVLCEARPLTTKL